MGIALFAVRHYVLFGYLLLFAMEKEEPYTVPPNAKIRLIIGELLTIQLPMQEFKQIKKDTMPLYGWKPFTNKAASVSVAAKQHLNSSPCIMFLVMVKRIEEK